MTPERPSFLRSLRRSRPLKDVTEEADADLDIAFERLAQALVHNDQVSQDLQRQQSDSRFKKVVVPAVVLTEPDPVDAR